MAEQQKTDNFLDKELKRLYERLKEFPERGYPKVEEGEADGEITITYTPSKNVFVADKKEDFYGTKPTISAWKFIVELYDQYGVAPATTIVDEGQYKIIASQVSPHNRWYQNTSTHLSKDGSFYIVPVIYETMKDNPSLKPFFVNGKLNVTNLLKGDTAQSKYFLNAAKRWALDKAANDLAKAINSNHKKQSETMGFFPIDSKTKGKEGFEIAAEAWYIDPRPPEHQNLFLKVMFPRAWIDALPPRLSPCLDFGGTTRTVILFGKSLKKDLSDLQSILNRFGHEIKRSSIHIDFDAACFAGKVSKIAELLNKFLKLNGKPGLGESSKGALQFGFTEEMQLHYVAYSETPDCLCDENNINAYTLKKGIDKLKTTPPFDTPTVNGLLFYLPEIMRRYSKYLVGNKRQFLFSAQESFLRFIRSFVYPPPRTEATYDTSETEAEFYVKKIMDIGNAAKSAGNITKNILYTRDPTVIMAPHVRQRLLGAANAQVVYGGDKIMLDALTSEMLSMTAVYDNLLNKVPMTELIKLALTAIVKCIPDGDLRRKLCSTIFKTMPLIEIKAKLIPCLHETGNSDAVTFLETKMLNRRRKLYEQAKVRAPDKFQKTAEDAIKSELDMAAVNELYCSDPEFQQLLGRPADDFSEEMLLALQSKHEEAICNCILTVYGPVQQIFGFVEDMKDTVSDIVDVFASNKAQAIEQQTSVSLDRLLQPFYTMDRRTLSDFAKSIATALVEVLVAMVFGAIIIVLNHVKDTVLGSLATGECGWPANPFSEKNFSNMVKNSVLYKDMDFNKLKNDIKDMASAAGFSGEILALMESLNNLGGQFSPHEFKRIFTTPCHDNSADDLYKKIKLPGGHSPILTSPTTACVNAANALAAGKSLEDIETSFCGMPEVGAIPIDAIHTLLAGIGSRIDPIFFEDMINEWEDTEAELINFCDPVSIAEFAETIDPADIPKLANKNKEALLEDIVAMLPLLDQDKLVDMMPPIFCGPCNPRKIGQKPLMQTQTPAPIVDTFERMNDSTFKAINTLFNNTIDIYKSLLMAQTEAQVGFTQGILDAKIKMVDDEGNELPPGTIPKASQITAAQDEAKAAMWANAMGWTEENKSKTVGGALLEALETAAATDVHLVAFGGMDIFRYEVPPTATSAKKEIYLCFNPATQTVSFKGFQIPKNSVKIIVIEAMSNKVLYEWPDATDVASINALAGVSYADAGESWQDTRIQSPILRQLTPGFKPDEIDYAKYYVDIIQLTLENVFVESTHHDLFNGVVFNKIPLTDLEAEQACSTDIGATPLLNPDKLKKDVDQIRKNLECAISRFDTPNALEVAAVFGIVKMLLKVCIVEECLKNIFIFGFLRVGDITQAEPYMALILNNVSDSLHSSVGQDNYEKVLDYSSKIINGRIQTGETIPTPPGSSVSDEPVQGPLGPIPVLRSPKDCLKVLILESANEISDIFDHRVQAIIDPVWQEKFKIYENVDDPAIKNILSDKLVEYVISSSPEYWSPNLYPFDYGTGLHHTAGGLEKSEKPFSGLCPMRLLSTTSNDWPLQFKGAKDSNENFEDLTDFFANTGWPNRGENDDLPWSGGFFFQPYIRIDSALDKGAASAPTAKERWKDGAAAFWKSFKVAYDQKRAMCSLFPEHVSDFDLALWTDIISSNKHATFVKTFIEDMITTIEDQAFEQTGYTSPGDQLDTQKMFDAFFSFLFHPTAGNTSVDTKSFENSLFQRLVSSYMVAPTLDPYTNPKQFSYNVPLDTGNHSCYYWQKEDDGSVAGPFQSYEGGNYTTQVDIPKWNWANRGVVSTNLAVGGDLGSPDSVPQNSNEMHRRRGSTIAMMGYAKEFGPPAQGDDYDETAVGQQALQDQAGPLRKINQFLLNQSGKMGTDANFDVGQTTPQLPPPAEVLQVALEDYEYAKTFWKAMRNILFDSDASLWFDFKIGMRLNMIFKIDDIESTDFEAVAEVMNSTLGPGNDYKAYNEEKSFIWQKNKNETYFCLPMEYVEEDAYEKYKAQAKTWHHGDKNDLGPAIVKNVGSADAPALWAICRAMDIALSGKNKNDTLDKLKLKLLKKIKKDNTLVDDFKMNELVSLVAVVYRQYTQSAYPSIDTLLSALKITINRYLVQTLAAINDDYQHVDALIAETNALTESSANSPSTNDLVLKFLAMCLQMGANVVDPTWKTPWLMPGPLTPVGILAKSLATNWTEDDDDPKAQDLAAGSEYCPPEPGTEKWLDELEKIKKKAAAEKAAAEKAAADKLAAEKAQALADIATMEEEWNTSKTVWVIELLDEKMQAGWDQDLGPFFGCQDPKECPEAWKTLAPIDDSCNSRYLPHKLNGSRLRIPFNFFSGTGHHMKVETVYYDAVVDYTQSTTTEAKQMYNYAGGVSDADTIGVLNMWNPCELGAPIPAVHDRLIEAMAQSLNDFAAKNPQLGIEIEPVYKVWEHDSTDPDNQTYGKYVDSSWPADPVPRPENPRYHGGQIRITAKPGMHSPEGDFLEKTKAKLFYGCIEGGCEDPLNVI